MSAARSALVLTALSGLLLVAAPALAVPRMSVTAGSPCATCHVNPTGGGLRNVVGFESMYKVGLFEYGVSPHNTFLDDMLSVGIDARIQVVRLGAPEIPPGKTEIVEPELYVLPMQIQPYLMLQLAKGLSIYGSWAAGPETFDESKFCDPIYPGQSCFDAAVQYKIGPTLPTVRAGMIQPSIGVRRDDHTIYIRGDAADRRAPIIPPNYADWGAEAMWQPKSYFRAEVGGLATQNLDEALNTGTRQADLWPAAVSGRVTFLPQFVFGGAEEKADDEDEFGDDFDDFDAPPPPDPIIMNTWFGASAFASGDMLRVDAFAAAGLSNGLEMHLEAAMTQLAGDYRALAGLLGASWALWEHTVVAARVERATTQIDAETDAAAWQAVVGLEFFPVPFVEIRPEYRIVRTDDYLFGQPTVQLHLFY